MASATINVLYFAQVAELTQKRQESWPLSEALTVKSWLEQLIQHYPQLEPLHKRLKIAINQYHVDHEATINVGDEVAVFEPVTGG